MRVGRLGSEGAPRQGGAAGKGSPCPYRFLRHVENTTVLEVWGERCFSYTGLFIEEGGWDLCCRLRGWVTFCPGSHGAPNSALACVLAPGPGRASGDTQCWEGGMPGETARSPARNQEVPPPGAQGWRAPAGGASRGLGTQRASPQGPREAEGRAKVAQLLGGGGELSEPGVTLRFPCPAGARGWTCLAS